MRTVSLGLLLMALGATPARAQAPRQIGKRLVQRALVANGEPLVIRAGIDGTTQVDIDAPVKKGSLSVTGDADIHVMLVKAHPKESVERRLLIQSWEELLPKYQAVVTVELERGDTLVFHLISDPTEFDVRVQVHVPVRDAGSRGALDADLAAKVALADISRALLEDREAEIFGEKGRASEVQGNLLTVRVRKAYRSLWGTLVVFDVTNHSERPLTLEQPRCGSRGWRSRS